MKTKIYNIQLFRGIAVLLVLFFHIMLMEKKWSTLNPLLSDFLVVGQSGVDLFFVISGFVMVTITRGRFQNPSAIAQYAYNRLTRIYPTYWLYSLLLAIVYLFQPTLINPTLGNEVHFISSFLLLPQDKLPLLMVGWTLVYEMYFYLVFASFMLAPQKHLLKLLLSWAVGIVLVHFFRPNPITRNMISSTILLTSPLCLEFIGGCLAAVMLHNGFFHWRRTCFALGVFCLIVNSIWAWADHSITIINPVHRLLLFGLPYVAIIYGAVAMEMNDGRVFLSFLRPIGDASYSIYLSHTIIINAVGWLWINSARGSIPILWLLLMLTGSIFIGLLSYRFLELPVLVFCKKRFFKNNFRNQPIDDHEKMHHHPSL